MKGITRRSFLKKLGIGIGVLLIPATLVKKTIGGAITTEDVILGQTRLAITTRTKTFLVVDALTAKRWSDALNAEAKRSSYFYNLTEGGERW